MAQLFVITISFLFNFFVAENVEIWLVKICHKKNNHEAYGHTDIDHTENKSGSIFTKEITTFTAHTTVLCSTTVSSVFLFLRSF